MLLGCAPPPKPYTRPRHPQAEVRWSDGTWRRVTIRAWCRATGEQRHNILTARPVDWLVFLQFPDGMGSEDGWRCFNPHHLRRT